MRFIIDGHNLIGSGVFKDIRLDDENDEAKLVLRLQVMKTRSITEMTVVFDRGVLEGKSKELSRHGIDVVFARNPREADDIIICRMQASGKDLIVVSNDAELRREARESNVKIWTSDQFLKHLSGSERQTTESITDPGDDPDIYVPQAELEEWLTLFQNEEEDRNESDISEQ